MSVAILMRNLTSLKLPLCSCNSFTRTMLMSSKAGASDPKIFISPIKLDDKNNRASPEQLDYVANVLVSHVPRFFSQPHPFNIYTKDLVFIDNIRSVKVHGTGQYATHLALIKIYFNIRYTSIKVETLNLVKNPEESYVKIRWRIITKPGLFRLLFAFYKIKSLENWTDGLSTLHVNKEGKIYCHVCDNIDVEIDELKIKKVVKNPLVDRGLNV